MKREPAGTVGSCLLIATCGSRCRYPAQGKRGPTSQRVRPDPKELAEAARDVRVNPRAKGFGGETLLDPALLRESLASPPRINPCCQSICYRTVSTLPLACSERNRTSSPGSPLPRLSSSSFLFPPSFFAFGEDPFVSYRERISSQRQRTAKGDLQLIAIGHRPSRPSVRRRGGGARLGRHP